MTTLLFALLLAQPTPPEPPSPEPAATAGVPAAPDAATEVPAAPEALPAPTPPKDAVLVEVSYLTPDGRLEPAAAEVRLERLRMPRPDSEGTPTLVAAWTTTASPDGRAYLTNIPPLETAESDRVVARYLGTETTLALTPERNGRLTPVRLVLESKNRDLSALSLTLRVSLTPTDRLFRVEHILRFDNRSMSTVDTDDADGLILPLIVPAPFGDPTLPLLPGRPEPNEFFFEMQPELGRLLPEKGRLVYRGPIPVEGLAIRVVMGLPYGHQTRHDLGLVSPLEVSRLTFSMQAPSHLAPTLSTSQPSEVLVRNVKDGEERSISLLSPLTPNTPVLLKIEGTPDRHSLMRPLVAGLSVAVVIALLLLLLSSRNRAQESRPSP
jgi:hypothetical protein